MSNRVVFIYGKGSFVSGQWLASKLVVDGLRERGWRVDVIHIPLLNRMSRLHVGHLVVMAWRLLIAWYKALTAMSGMCAVCVNLGQTRFALVRDGMPLLLKGLFTRNGHAIVSLHGNLLMGWTWESTEARLLRLVVRAAQYVTVLGERQKEQIVRLGVPSEKVIWLDNTSELFPIDKQVCVQKHNRPNQMPIRVLHLGSLFEAKGYVEFVQAIALLSQCEACPVEATLCGPIVRMDDDVFFGSRDKARGWIESQVEQINRSSCVRLCWIDGAFGVEKEALFREAHVFVLPSRYLVEAQPLTILEALASGCVVVTTKVGEIPSTVSVETAIFLENSTPEVIAQAIADLYDDKIRCTELALNGLRLFRKRFSLEWHLDRWENLFKSCLA